MYTYTFHSQEISACNKKYKAKKPNLFFAREGGRGGNKEELIQK